MCACFLAVMFGSVPTTSLSSVAHADPVAFEPTQTTPDPPAPSPPGPPPVLRPSWDLDGTYLWLGPIGAASYADQQWDSTFGGDATLVRIRERELVGTIGGTFGASKWTTRSGGQLWLDVLAGTHVLGHMIGVSAGPILELSDAAHPRFGGSIGLWGFVGVAPFIRAGIVDSSGGFAEIGVHIALPVIRR